MSQEIQSKVTGLVPAIQELAYFNTQILAQISERERMLAEIPEVQILKGEIQALKLTMQENEAKELELRETGKDMMLQNGLKTFTTLDGTTISLNSTPGALTIEDGAVIPEQYYRVKKEVDKTAIKKAFNDGVQFDEKIYISKDYKLVIKSK